MISVSVDTNPCVELAALTVRSLEWPAEYALSSLVGDLRQTSLWQLIRLSIFRVAELSGSVHQLALNRSSQQPDVFGDK